MTVSTEARKGTLGDGVQHGKSTGSATNASRALAERGGSRQSLMSSHEIVRGTSVGFSKVTDAKDRASLTKMGRDLANKDYKGYSEKVRKAYESYVRKAKRTTNSADQKVFVEQALRQSTVMNAMKAHHFK